MRAPFFYTKISVYCSSMALLESKKLSPGFTAPDFKLPGTDGKEYSLSDFGASKGLLVIFTCNHCPYAQAAWPLTIDLYNQFKEAVAFVAINSNDAEEYPEDSFEGMKDKIGEWNIPFPYLRDESQEVARTYQAQCTPDLYLFKNEDGVFKLFYHGRINDNWQEPKKVTEENLKDALSRLVEDKDTPENQPPSMGCSIKWKDK